MKLIIVRHGETIENASNIVMGQIPGKLSEKGIEQAKKVAQRLKNEKIDYIYCSDLQRTKDTLAEILKYQDIPVVYDPLLREKTNGIYDGTDRSIYHKVRDSHNQNARWRAPKGENFYDIRGRVKKFVEYLRSHHSTSDTILIITHGGWKCAFFSYVLGIPRMKSFFLDPDNTAVSTFVLNENGKHKLELMNCTKHLDE